MSARVYVLRKAGGDLAWNGFGWVALDAGPRRYTRREHAEREAKILETTPTWIEVVDGEPGARDPLDLDAIDARASGATPGPWGLCHSVDARGKGYIRSCGPDAMLAWREGGSRPAVCRITPTGHDPATARSNTSFIEHAREDVPALVRLVRAWEAFYRARDAYHRHSMTDEWNAYEAARAALIGAGGPADLARD